VKLIYEGRLEATNEVFGKALTLTLTFLLGAGDFIQGEGRGILGMKVGGKRKLIVPAKLGHGAKGAISRNSTEISSSLYRYRKTSKTKEN